jgi:exopolysaccharide production protein ExoZ
VSHEQKHRSQTDRPGQLLPVQMLRAVAAIGVVFTHAITRTSNSILHAGPHSVFANSVEQLTVGDAGVDLFFIISGFIMLYVHKNDFSKPGAPARFMTRRIFRIVPIYWLLTTAAIAVLIFAPQLYTIHYNRIDLGWIASSYLFVPGTIQGQPMTPVVTVGWTLNYEMLFYVVFAAALLLPRSRAIPALCVFFGCAVLAGVLFAPSNPWLMLATSWLLLDFLIGLGIACWVDNGGRLSMGARTLLLSIGLAGLAATVFWSPPEQGPLRLAGWGLPMAMIFFATCTMKLPGNRTTRTLGLLGNASYSIYLFQFFALPAWGLAMARLHARVLPFDVDVLILTALVTLSGLVFWLLVEQPIASAIHYRAPRDLRKQWSTP